MGELYTVLAVDDSSLNHKIIEKAVSGHYQFRGVFSGQECLDFVAKTTPDLILLDVTMSGMDGYETCTELRKLPLLLNVPVLFLSGRCSVEEKLKGYEVGGDDYITKPFQAEELLAKIKKAIGYRKNAEKLDEKAKKAIKLASSAIKENNHIAIALSFFQRAFQCHSFQDLAVSFFDVMAQYALPCTVCFWHPKEQIIFYDDGIVRPLEAELLLQARNKEVVWRHGKRMILNFKNLSLLIKNTESQLFDVSVPMEGVLTTLLSGMDARFLNLVDEFALQHEKNCLTDIVEKMRSLINCSRECHQNLSLASSKSFERLMNRTEKTVARYQLDEHQEESILSEIRRCESEIVQLYTALVEEESRLSAALLESDQTMQGDRIKQDG
mgnify:CR=1 FL=1